jgi:hypothetical protein
MNAEIERGKAMPRSVWLKSILVAVLVVLLLPALVYITSPFWAARACRWAAARWLKADVRFATAVLNPFNLSLDAAGGTFTAPGGEAYQASGELSRFRVRIDPGALIRERRIRELAVELASLTVTLAEGRELSSASPVPGLPVIGGLARPAAAVVESGAAKPWTIQRLRLRIDRGVIRYSRGGRRGEMSMELGFNAAYDNVGDIKKLAGEVLGDLLSKAAYGFLTERLFR